MPALLSALPSNPLFTFTLLLLVILILPPLFERLRLPGLVGLLFAGVVLGKNGFQWLDPNSESIGLLSDIGKIYLMFVAGLEIDLVEFKRTRNRSLSFGLSTFLVPMIVGTGVGRLFNFDWNASILIGSLMASHTLLAYPIVQRLGVVKREAVMITVGATIFTDIAALLVLAVCLAIHAGDFSAGTLILQLTALAVYSFVVLVGFDWAGKEYFRRTGDEQSNQFLFVLLAVFLAAVGAQIINIEQIVGAFLAGLAVNDAVGNGPVKEKIEFLGSTLFIPFFFVGMGLLLDVPAFIETLRFNFPLMAAIVLGLIGAKFLAAFIVQKIFRYSWAEGMVMGSLSLPQVAATLAAEVAAYEAVNGAGGRQINVNVLNSVIVLMLVTSILGPLLTAKFAPKLPLPKTFLEPEDSAPEPGLEPLPNLFTILLPLANPQTLENLLEMAALLARDEGGGLLPLAIAPAHVHMDDPQLTENLEQKQRLLEQAATLAQKYRVATNPLLRIDDDVALGISRAAKENNANLIILGWSEKSAGLRARVFGSLIDSVFWSAHCPVAVMRLLDRPQNFRRILLPLKNLSPQSLQTFHFTQLLGGANQAQITILHVCDRQTPPEQLAAFKTDLEELLAQSPLHTPYQVKVVNHENAAKVIVRVSSAFDLVVLRSFRRRTAGGVAVSEITDQVIHNLDSSLVLFGEPHS